MPIQFTGIGSGLDVESLVSQLMALERRPLELIEAKKTEYNTRLSAYGSMKATLSTLQGAASAISGTAKFRAATASIADTSIATASASPGALAGSYSLEVQVLAQAHKLRSNVFASTASNVGSGTVTIELGTYSGASFTLNPERTSKTIAIGTGQQTLAGVRDAINAANADASASIIDDGTGPRLVLSSKHTGLANAMRVQVQDDDGNHTNASGLSQLVYNGATGGTKRLTETAVARNSTVRIDGITVSKSSNTITDAIEGVTLNLVKIAVGSPTTLSIARDVEGAKTAVDAFVKAYNDTANSLRTMSSYDPATRVAGSLQGDSALISVQSRMRTALSAVVQHAGGYASLSALGIAFQKDGTLLADATKLRAALANTALDAASALAAVGTTSDSLIRFASASSDAAEGVVPVTVTQLATQGKATASKNTGLTITAGSNDTLQLTVNGVAQSVTLTPGTYTAVTMAAMLQSRIAGVEASASGEVLTLRSKTWGSASSVDITGGTARSDLFGSPTNTAGVNAAGTINGVAASATGRELTAQGLTVTVEGGATGARGTVRFSRGIAERLQSLIDDMLDDTITTRTEGISVSIRTLDTRRDVTERRLETVEQRLRAQFAALDNMIASMNATSSFLTQQLASLPGSGNNG